ncbi:MAG: tetratricopeptide repeat protein, partial [Planctomycetes bacterium]|nr:tetratricopeptide repeat protein [Planctomycetota bacterium]
MRACLATDPAGRPAGWAEIESARAASYRGAGGVDAPAAAPPEPAAGHPERGARVFAGWCAHELGAVELTAGRFDRALRHAQRAHNLSIETGVRALEAAALVQFGLIHQRQNDPLGAISLTQKALAPERALGDGKGEAETLGALGESQVLAGNDPAALTHYREALERQRERGDRRGEGAVLLGLCALYGRLGSLAEALGAARAGLAALRDAGDRRGEATALAALGRLLGRTGDLPSALDTSRRALALLREAGDRA